MTVGGEPRIQGVCVVFDATTLAPVALDRRHRADQRPHAGGLGAGGARARRARRAPAARVRPRPAGPWRTSRPSAPCARSSTSTWSAATPATSARSSPPPTSSAAPRPRATPLFDGSLVADHATVVAIGSHEPDAREIDDALARRATVVVESRASALREAGDVIGAIAAGALARGRARHARRSRLRSRVAGSRRAALVQEHRDGVGGRGRGVGARPLTPAAAAQRLTSVFHPGKGGPAADARGRQLIRSRRDRR